MVKSIEENRKILRRYIRLLTKHTKVPHAKDAINYFIIVHNFLGIEDLFYDQCLIHKKQLNAHLFLANGVDYYSTVISYYRSLYNPNHNVRYNIETMDSIEEVRLFLESDECKYIHSKLIMECKSIKVR